MHAHVHLIPRRIGDVENPRGGVRGTIPDGALHESGMVSGYGLKGELIKRLGAARARRGSPLLTWPGTREGGMAWTGTRSPARKPANYTSVTYPSER